jgi:hypothetical protein
MLINVEQMVVDFADAEVQALRRMAMGLAAGEPEAAPDVPAEKLRAFWRNMALGMGQVEALRHNQNQYLRTQFDQQIEPLRGLPQSFEDLEP